jgi:hypothetical protein
MPDENELGTQPGAESVTAEIPGNDAAPEQGNEELHTESGEGNEGGEQQPAAIEPTEEVKTEKPKQTFYEKRFGELTFEKREAQRKLDEALAEIATLKGTKPAETSEAAPVHQPVPAATSDDAVERRAAQIVDQRAFEARRDAMISAGEKEFETKAFAAKCNLVADIGERNLPSFMSLITDPEIVTDGHKVIAALADNPEEAHRILNLPQIKMALELTKLSEKLGKPATPKTLSKVPPPVDPVNGGARSANKLDDPNTPMEEFGPAFLKMMRGRG